MTRTLLVRLITLGDPERLSGGYLYHRRLAQLAPEHGAELRFVSVPEWPFPLPALAGGAVLRRALGPVAAAPGAPAGDLRAGRRAALLCVANWVERKGILETLEALARLDACAATLHL